MFPILPILYNVSIDYISNTVIHGKTREEDSASRKISPNRFFYTEFIVFTRLPPLWRDSASGLMVNIQIMSGLAGFTCLYRQVGISSVCIYFISIFYLKPHIRVILLFKVRKDGPQKKFKKLFIPTFCI
jgi:hypothetical protein